MIKKFCVWLVGKLGYGHLISSVEAIHTQIPVEVVLFPYFVPRQSDLIQQFPPPAYLNRILSEGLANAVREYMTVRTIESVEGIEYRASILVVRRGDK